jgi:hypothetical protein
MQIEAETLNLALKRDLEKAIAESDRAYEEGMRGCSQVLRPKLANQFSRPSPKTHYSQLYYTEPSSTTYLGYQYSADRGL